MLSLPISNPFLNIIVRKMNNLIMPHLHYIYINYLQLLRAYNKTLLSLNGICVINSPAFN